MFDGIEYDAARGRDRWWEQVTIPASISETFYEHTKEDFSTDIAFVRINKYVVCHPEAIKSTPVVGKTMEGAFALSERQQIELPLYWLDRNRNRFPIRSDGATQGPNSGPPRDLTWDQYDDNVFLLSSVVKKPNEFMEIDTTSIAEYKSKCFPSDSLAPGFVGTVRYEIEEIRTQSPFAQWEFVSSEGYRYWYGGDNQFKPRNINQNVIVVNSMIFQATVQIPFLSVSAQTIPVEDTRVQHVVDLRVTSL